jgi:hypothetical protein
LKEVGIDVDSYLPQVVESDSMLTEMINFDFDEGSRGDMTPVGTGTEPAVYGAGRQRMDEAFSYLADA